MFRQHAGGADLVEQLKFMADEGFRALEDNGMQGTARSPTRNGSARAARGSNMAMGVFVAHTITWTEPTLDELATPPPRCVPHRGARIDRRREAGEREVDDRRAGSRRPAAGDELPDRATSSKR